MDVNGSERGPRGVRGRSSHGEWIRWGLTMLAALVAINAASDAHTAGTNAESAAKDAKHATHVVSVQSKRADNHIVRTGREVIVNGCQFDNVRARELRGILKNGLKNQAVQYKKGAITKERYLLSRKLTQQAVDSISIRNCAKEARTLKEK